MHSGWAAVIASSANRDVVYRGIIRMIDESLPGSAQPYHHIEHWALPKAETHLAQCTERSNERTRSALLAILTDLQQRGFQPAACGILAASGRPLGSLESILSSHALIHTAEGEFFRGIIRTVADHFRLTAFAIPEKQLKPSSADMQRLAQIGKQLGPPWRQDEKLATLASWLALRLS